MKYNLGALKMLYLVLNVYSDVYSTGLFNICLYAKQNHVDLVTASKTHFRSIPEKSGTYCKIRVFGKKVFIIYDTAFRTWAKILTLML